MNAPGRAPRVLLALLAGLLAGCSSLLGGAPRQATRVYDPAPALQPADPAWPSVGWSLSLTASSDSALLDGQRLLVSPGGEELQPYRGVAWARAPTAMVESAVLRTLEDSGKILAVARSGSGQAAEYRLLLEVRRFQAEVAGGPSVRIEVGAKLLKVDAMAIAGSRSFEVRQAAASDHADALAAAFASALGRLGHDIAGWTLATGQAPSAPLR
ncbi:ABC-type transport auxiliary lipoprotein family protein [Thermomonas alba]|uniref:ABC-type transport auxiliary lipoprotein family protein n=1 Tax=Thermomonas alba TaxID=2888525 RepID=UPI001F04B6C4|nr:ABC-type transport auxiliary lipoprotein family protein [Thermomonas alba]